MVLTTAATMPCLPLLSAIFKQSRGLTHGARRVKQVRARAVGKASSREASGLHLARQDAWRTPAHVFHPVPLIHERPSPRLREPPPPPTEHRLGGRVAQRPLPSPLLSAPRFQVPPCDVFTPPVRTVYLSLQLGKAPLRRVFCR